MWLNYNDLKKNISERRCKDLTEQEAFEVLEAIAEFYRQFEITEKKIRVFIPALMKLDYKGTMKKLEAHVLEKPYPPTIAEIAVLPPASQRPEEQEWRKIERFREEAKKVRPEVKEKFRRDLQALLNKHGVKDDD